MPQAENERATDPDGDPLMLLPRKALERRNALKRHFDVAKQFETIEESCIPSYAHPNPLAAWVSWLRLQQAAALYRKWAPNGDILDFGSATGEIFHLVEPKGEYWFVEENELLVDAMHSWIPHPHRTDIDNLGSRRFAAVFALDSLEHNKGIEVLIEKLQASLVEEGVMILSGPTENALYRLGRRLARFDGHYHFQTIWDIEAKVSTTMELLERRLVPIGIPLFSLSAWRVRWQ